MSIQAIGAFDVALWDLKARRAGLSLAKLLGAHRESVRCYNTSGGFLHTPTDQLLVNAAASRERGIGGIKLKVGQPDGALDVRRVEAVRKHLGDAVPIMVDANQQWDRPDRPAHVPHLRAVQPGLDRGAAGRLRPRRPRGAGGCSSTRRSPPARC